MLKGLIWTRFFARGFRFGFHLSVLFRVLEALITDFMFLDTGSGHAAHSDLQKTSGTKAIKGLEYGLGNCPDVQGQ